VAEQEPPKCLKIIESVLLVAVLLVAVGLSVPGLLEKERAAYTVPNLIEAESLTMKAKSQNIFLQKQETRGFHGRWTGDTHFFGMAYAANDWVEWLLPNAGAGRFQLIAYLTKSNDYGVIRFLVDGKPVGEPIDLYNANIVVPTGKIVVGEFQASSFTPVLRLEVVGKNAANPSSHYFFGLDGIVIEKK
jgi:hypothetical protein